MYPGTETARSRALLCTAVDIYDIVVQKIVILMINYKSRACMTLYSKSNMPT